MITMKSLPFIITPPLLLIPPSLFFVNSIR
jgi:hypothetical protein